MIWQATLLSPSLVSSSSFIFLYNKQHNPPHSILSQINLPLQLQSPQHSVFQHLCSDSNFIKNFPLQISKTIHFLFELNFKMLIFVEYVMTQFNLTSIFCKFLKNRKTQKIYVFSVVLFNFCVKNKSCK